ncbi:MAG: glycosyltransferase family 4 protein [Pseudomonadota bacterium]
MKRFAISRHPRAGRRAHKGPLINILDPTFYAAQYDDAGSTTAGIYAHFQNHGLKEDRQFNRWHSAAYTRRFESRKSLRDLSAAQAYYDSGLHRKPRLIFVSHDASRTGAPAIILRLLKMFSETGAFECFTLLDDGGERLHEFEELSHCYVMSQSRYSVEMTDEARHAEISALFDETGIFEGNAPLCALVNSAESFHIGRSLARMGLPVIQLLHEFSSYYPESLFEEIFRFSTRVIFPSHFIHKTAAQYCAIDETKVTVRGQGLLDDAFGQMNRDRCRVKLRQDLKLPETARIFLNVGSMDQRKGVDLFVHAARAYFERRPEDEESYFVWYGKGDDAPGGALELARRLLSETGLDDRVRLMPSTNRIEQVFLGGDVFVLTARADPFPCVIHEAMACGLPIIAFRDGGGAQELIGESCGTLVDMGDVVALAEALARTADDPKMAAAQGGAGRDLIARDWQYEDYFRDVGAELKAQLPAGTPWPALTVPAPIDHLVVMPARVRSLQSADLARKAAEGARLKVLFLDGRFSDEAEACIEACRKMGVDYAMGQPLQDTALARQVILDAAIREPRPRYLTLVDTLEFVSPAQLSVFDYPIDVIETGRVMTAQRLGHYLPYVAAMRLSDAVTRQKVSTIYGPLRDKVHAVHSGLTSEASSEA